MLVIKKRITKGLVNWLLTLKIFKRSFVVLSWGDSYVIKRTKPIEELVKNEISPENIFTLKFKYYSSTKVMKEYVADIFELNYESREMHLNIWTNEQKTSLVRKSVLNLTPQTNDELRNIILTNKVFYDKHGGDESYLLTLFLDSRIVSAAEDSRQFSKVIVKYVLKPTNRKAAIRIKRKVFISSSEAKELCSMISYWDI